MPKGRKFKPLVAEYGFYVKWAAATNINFSEQKFLHNFFPKEQRLCIDSSTGVFFGSMQVKTMTSNGTRHALFFQGNKDTRAYT